MLGSQVQAFKADIEQRFHLNPIVPFQVDVDRNPFKGFNKPFADIMPWLRESHPDSYEEIMRQLAEIELSEPPKKVE